MKKMVVFLGVVIIGLSFIVEVLASSGGAPQWPSSKKSEPKSEPVTQPKETQPKGAPVLTQPKTPAPVVAQPVPADLKRQRALIAKKRDLLNNTEWDVTLIPLSGKGRNLDDTIVFSEGKVFSKKWVEQDFKPTNFSLNLKEEDRFVWETMQTSGEEIIFYKGELDFEMEVMSGVISYQRLEGPENYSFKAIEKRPYVALQVSEEM